MKNYLSAIGGAMLAASLAEHAEREAGSTQARVSGPSKAVRKKRKAVRAARRVNRRNRK